MAQELKSISDELAAAVAAAAPAIVSVDDGSRFTATGIVWSGDGVVVTTSHGVERDENLSVLLQKGSRHAATLVGRDDETDIAILHIDGAENLPTITRPDSDATPGIGGLALAVGSPGGPGITATLGIVSRVYETETDGVNEYIINTDATLFPGFSGGPLLSADGVMLGLLNRMYGRGMGVALGAPMVARVVTALLAHGRMPKGYLGIKTQLVALPENLRAGFALAQKRGLLIAGVGVGSPAEAAGLVLGDTLLKIDGAEIQDVEDLRRHLKANQKVQLEILRGGAVMELPAVVGLDKG